MGAAHKKNHKRNKRGTKKGDKIHGQKAGKKGEAAAYITRAQALAKLQISLADFRRLCILKGIYPRDPKKKPSGQDKTYYHSKDISFLSHEPLLNKFFEMKTFMKKFKRLMGRKERELASGLEERKPMYTLNHLVRERYPTFEDAVRDMDDSISMLALFQALSADQKRDIPTEAVNEATQLYQEFQLYVIRSQALRKVFASIKGYYFQAEIHGQNVTWLSPHQFAQNLPAEVDFRVMLTFLEFARATMKFVNFKLYADLGLEYPPKRIAARDAGSADVAALETEMREAGQARQAQSNQADKADAEVAAGVEEDFGDNEETKEMQRQLAMATRMKTAFRGLKVFINREVPLRPVYFTLLCGGVAEAGWERGASAAGSSGPGSAFPASSKNITHQVVDRPADQLELRPGREYIQPQWVFDSFNTGCLLPIAPYGPGRAPPPHLSPFVDDKAEGYVPRQRDILDKFAAEAAGVAPTTSSGTGAAATNSGATISAQGAFDKFSKELRAETDGVWHSEFRDQTRDEAETTAAAEQAGADSGSVNVTAPEKGDEEDGEAPARRRRAAADEAANTSPRPTETEEERLRAKALMPKKHKRLLQRIEKSAKNKSDANANLMKKRRLAEPEQA